MTESASDTLTIWLELGAALAVDVGQKLVGALLLYIVGRMLISMAKNITGRALAARSVDSTVTNYVNSGLGVLLNVVLIVMILGVFGVETTTFAGVLAAGGVAIGMAWSGLLAHFAAGMFLLVLRPFKVGDFVTAGGVTGTIEEIGLFVTAVNTPDNVRTFIGNNTIFSGNIQNFSTNPLRRVELKAQLAHGVDPADAIAKLRTAVAAIPNVSTETGPDLEILEFNLAGPVLAVRPHTHTDHYWQVYFDTNKAIAETFGAAGYPVPESRYTIMQKG